MIKAKLTWSIFVSSNNLLKQDFCDVINQGTESLHSICKFVVALRDTLPSPCHWTSYSLDLPIRCCTDIVKKETKAMYSIFNWPLVYSKANSVLLNDNHTLLLRYFIQLNTNILIIWNHCFYVPSDWPSLFDITFFRSDPN